MKIAGPAETPGSVVRIGSALPRRIDVAWRSAPGGIVTDAPEMGPSASASSEPPSGPITPAWRAFAFPGMELAASESDLFARFGGASVTEAFTAPADAPPLA